MYLKSELREKCHGQVTHIHLALHASHGKIGYSVRLLLQVCQNQSSGQHKLFSICNSRALSASSAIHQLSLQMDTLTWACGRLTRVIHGHFNCDTQIMKVSLLVWRKFSSVTRWAKKSDKHPRRLSSGDADGANRLADWCECERNEMASHSEKYVKQNVVYWLIAWSRVTLFFQMRS